MNLDNLKNSMEDEVNSAKDFAKAMLCLLLGEEKGNYRFPLLELLVDNCQMDGAPIRIGMAVMHASDEEFEDLKRLPTLQSILKTNSN